MAKLTTLRLCLSLAAQMVGFVFQLDVCSAYLNAELQDDVYLEQLEGFIPAGENGKKLHCKLLKSLHGLKQVGRE